MSNNDQNFNEDKNLEGAENPISAEEQKLLDEALDKWMHRLFDMTGRNKLLSRKGKPTDYLTISNRDSAEIFRMPLSNGGHVFVNIENLKDEEGNVDLKMLSKNGNKLIVQNFNYPNKCKDSINVCASIKREAKKQLDMTGNNPTYLFIGEVLWKKPGSATTEQPKPFVAAKPGEEASDPLPKAGDTQDESALAEDADLNANGGLEDAGMKDMDDQSLAFDEFDDADGEDPESDADVQDGDDASTTPSHGHIYGANDYEENGRAEPFDKEKEDEAKYAILDLLEMKANEVDDESEGSEGGQGQDVDGADADSQDGDGDGSSEKAAEDGDAAKKPRRPKQQDDEYSRAPLLMVSIEMNFKKTGNMLNNFVIVDDCFSVNSTLKVFAQKEF